MCRRFPAAVLAILLTLELLGAAPQAQMQPWLAKLGPMLQQRLTVLAGHSRIVVRATTAAAVAPLAALVRLSGGQVLRTLPVIDGLEIDLPNIAIATVAASSLTRHMSIDRPAAGAMERTGATIGATAARAELGVDGSGVGVAVIDSGIGFGLDDLKDANGASRVVRFVDFVNGAQAAYDDYGHGSHVAGIIGGNGFDSSGARSGVAPAASLVVLKVLDQYGGGDIAGVIAAIGYAVAHKDELHIRVINLSVASAVDESYDVDPLTLAAKQAVAAGIVVVAAAGNDGRGPDGRTQYGGITAPGNAPWVVTVGASSHMGTVDRSDDTIAAFSSRGPGAIDRAAKPDLVAPGVGIESLSAPGSRLYATMSPYLLPGTVPTSYLPYLSLSGTSMAAPVVAGTIALMLQANPTLTPNAVKAILEFTAETRPGYDPLTEGAGFLNAKGAVDLANYIAAPSALPYPGVPEWSAHIIWGNRLFHGGRFTADADAWSTGVTWGDAWIGGEPVAWGLRDDGGAWTYRTDAPNVVWGDACGGANCGGPWTIAGIGGAVTGTSDGDTVVWGTSDGDTVVWGTSSDGDTVVWGASCSDASCQPVIWPHS